MKGGSNGAADGKGKGKQRSGKGGGGGSSGSSAPMPCVLKFLAPEVLASAIIGKGGAVIAAMRESCQAKLALTEQGDFYPTTDCRVLTTSAATEEALLEVAKQILAKLAELVKTSAASDAIGHEGDLKLRMPVPRIAAGGVLGKQGATIKQIIESSGAKITISKALGNGSAAEQVITVSGTAEALEYVVSQVNHQIQILNTEAWFAEWAGSGSSNTVPAGLLGTGQGAGFNYTGRGAQQSPGIDLMMRVSQGLPPYVMEDSRGFAMSCVVPNRLVGGLIGRGGTGTKEVQTLTGTKIGIREIPDDPDNRSLNIAGPLANTCAAYMLMMKRYLDAEAQATQGTTAPVAAPRR